MQMREETKMGLKVSLENSLRGYLEGDPYGALN